MTLYNKYRPKTFDQLIQSKFSKTLSKDGLTHHAYLLFGHSGTGKTSAARLSMSEFCNNQNDINLCINGTHPDYKEINCAINNGVDDIKAIIADVVNTIPIHLKYKFIVFDEAHVLTTQSQNALLKTVEEPPSHIKFFFCTTEINKVIPAIRTRCQILPFFKLNEKSLLSILENVCSGEKLKFTQESLSLIISCADGSARSALNLIEQCATILEDSDSVAKILGTASQSSFKSLTKAFCSKKRVDTIQIMDDLFNNSSDPNSLMNKYADYIADLITTRICFPEKCEFDGKQLLLIGGCITDILKDFKILQNIKLISKIHVLKTIEKL